MAERKPLMINLRERFGNEYRIRFEESYYAERTRHTIDDPWLQIIPCQHGHICPWSEHLLAVCTNRRGPVTSQIRRLPFVQVVQDGSDGINATFPVERFSEIAEIVRPKRRRRLTPEQRAVAVERLRAFQFSRARQSALSDLKRAQTGQVDLRVDQDDLDAN